MVKIAVLSMVTAMLSFTISEMAVFSGIRLKIMALHPFLGEMVQCGFCLGCWIALFLVLLTRIPLYDSYLLAAAVVAWLSGFQWGLMCLLFERTGK